MREENIKRNSRKRLNALILLVAFTAILLIVATYAWFSTQRNVTLGGLEGTVNVAEGLQISLDAMTWANEIDLSSDAATYFALANETSGGSASFLNPYPGRTNLLPDEFHPVSTTGVEAADLEAGDLTMYTGEVQSGSQLINVADVTKADATGGYYALDFFLQNSSATTKVDAWDAAVEESSSTVGLGDLLQLEANSAVTLAGGTASESTGLQNTLRVAFAIYDDAGNGGELVSNTQNGQTEILGATTGDQRNILDVAIWEPNAYGAQDGGVGDSSPIKRYAAHVGYIVQNNNRLTLPTADQTAAGLDGTSRFEADTKLPTYALTAASKDAELIPTTEPETFDPGTGDIYDWDTTNAAAAGLQKQFTLQTPNTGVGSVNTNNPVQLVSAKDGTTSIEIAPGRYVHMRMYVWLEGQDVDCINYASLGGDLVLDIGLSKPATTEQGD